MPIYNRCALIAWGLGIKLAPDVMVRVMSVARFVMAEEGEVMAAIVHFVETVKKGSCSLKHC